MLKLPILPVDTGRYGTPEMKKIFEEETRVQKMLDVEAALAWAHAEVGDIPRKDAEKIASVCLLERVELRRIKEIEREIKHDIASLVRALAEACGTSGAYVHLGATSYDIVDTATALQLKDALQLIVTRLCELEKILMEKASKHKNTLMVGRTHGQHALPITLGFKFAVWTREVSRHIERLRQCQRRVVVGKMSGAVGTQAGLGADADRIQKLVMKRLRIEPADISTQIVQRDRYAEMVCVLAGIASSWRISQRKSANYRDLKSANFPNTSRAKNRLVALLCRTNGTPRHVREFAGWQGSPEAWLLRHWRMLQPGTNET